MDLIPLLPSPKEEEGMRVVLGYNRSMVVQPRPIVLSRPCLSLFPKIQILPTSNTGGHHVCARTHISGNCHSAADGGHVRGLSLLLLLPLLWLSLQRCVAFLGGDTGSGLLHVCVAEFVIK